MNYGDHLEGCCFIYVQGDEANIDKYYELVKLSKKDKLILYPERNMTLADTMCYIPYVKSVITENPYIISCYPAEKVFIIIDGEWVGYPHQTYGRSVNIIASDILCEHSSIPLMVLGGKKEIEKFRKNLKKGKTWNK